MKKISLMILVLTLLTSMSAPVIAADDWQTTLTYTNNIPEPSYTVTIPGSLDIKEGYSYLPITLTDFENSGDKKVTITFEGTQEPNKVGDIIYGYSFVLYPNGIPLYSGDAVIYQLFDANNDPLEYSYSGQTLAVFSRNGMKEIGIRLTNEDIRDTQPNVPYTGYIVFGIKCE